MYAGAMPGGALILSGSLTSLSAFGTESGMAGAENSMRWPA